MHIGIDPALSGALAVFDTAVRSTLRGVPPRTVRRQQAGPKPSQRFSSTAWGFVPVPELAI